ncbi:MAG: TetR/AcrR family transcriptional regulator [Methylovulum sp.]|uniref:TetR/AcrR family transcriptional regulator n=1 Tax=Methylovulum sp. TaxID=1916980 RepID=UPI0026143602|nr:TetR/AcrR family transcriptional regulator [Methylovulum sp.]MDD2724331.1 TetR/AcrR family transcriptional regulator [Methylovulum sp.]MDD5124927.1 TetR/AcrR family transcriptional regulator [Methylovulum sp.]
MTSKEKILSAAISLFAEKGYSGLSMRQLASAVDMSVAAIYHHFPDKNALYMAATRYAFSGKELIFAQVWEAQCPASEKMYKFVRALITVMSQDNEFCRLVQREIMEADPERMELLAQGVFKNQFNLLLQLAAELAPGRDSYLVATSIIGLVKIYVDHQPLNKCFPGWRPEYAEPGAIAAHVTDLLLNGLIAKEHTLNNFDKCYRPIP